MKNIFFCLLIPVIAFASEKTGNGYDITPRVINFLLFAAICYYLLANPLKNMYKNRIQKIADELESIQDKLSKSKEKKLALIQKVDEAKIEASNILSLAKEEAKLIVKKVEEQLAHEIKALEKAQNSKKEYESKKLKRELANKILAEVFADKSYDLNHDKVMDIVFKKVA